MTLDAVIGRVLGWSDQPLFTLGAKSISAGSLLLALVFLVGVWWLAGMMERSLLRVARGRGHEPGVQARVHMLSRLLRYGVWLIGTVVALHYGGNLVNYELVVWADRELTTHPAATQAKLMWALDDDLTRAGIAISFPQRDLHWRSGSAPVVLGRAPASTPTSEYGAAPQ